MAKQTAGRRVEKLTITPQHKTTSIGKSVNTKPRNKQARRSFKKYRGQG